MAERRKRVMLVFGTRPEAIKMTFRWCASFGSSLTVLARHSYA